MTARDTQLDQLYEAPLEQFTAVRDGLSRALRDAGDREAAQEFKGLRKPSVAAWALNQLRRRDQQRLAALLAAGERLEQAQRQLLAGGDRGLLRDAAADERRLVAELAAVAEGTLADAGHPVTATAQNRLRETLHAAAGNDEVRELLRAGRLTRDYQMSDLGLPVDAGKARRSSRPRRDGSTRGADAARQQQAAMRRLHKARALSREAEGKAKDAERAAAQSRRALAQAQAATASAEARADRARHRADEAAARVTELDAELKAPRSAGG